MPREMRTEERREGPSRRLLVQMLAIGAVVAAAGIALGLTIDWFPVAAATQAGPIDTLYDVLMAVSVVVFVLVVVVVLFSVWRFRMRAGEENEDGPPIHGNTRLEVVWTAIPALLLVGLCSYAWAVLYDIEKAKPNTLNVGVYGQQFAWTYRYTGPGGRQFSTDELYLPCTPTGSATSPGSPCKGRPVRFSIRAVDVVHSFWVPEFRMKQDAVPGITTTQRITPDRLGTYPVVCTELCGTGHATMRSTAHIVPPRVFAAWLARGGRAAPAGGSTSTAQLPGGRS